MYHVPNKQLNAPEMTSSAFSHPGLLRRLAAIIYDSLLVIALAMFITALVLIASEMIAGTDASQQTDLTRPYVQTAVLIGVFVFFCSFWRLRGQTLGMQAWRLKLTDQEGGTPSIWQCFVRMIGATLSAACLGLGYLWVVVDSEGLSWHDRLSGTRLSMVEKAS